MYMHVYIDVYVGNTISYIHVKNSKNYNKVYSSQNVIFKRSILELKEFSNYLNVY